MTTTSSRRAARRRHARRLLAHRAALGGGAALLGIVLPLTGLAAVHAADAVDDIPPLLDRFTFAPNANGWHRTDPNLRVVATERGGSAVASVSYILDGEPVRTIEAEAGATRLEVPIALSNHGVHELEVWTTDTAGNESFHQTGTYRVDTAEPYVSVPADGHYDVDEVAFLACDCGDLLSGVVLCTGPVDSGAQLDTTNPGTFTVPVTARDAAGNEATIVYTYTVTGPDIEGPVLDFGIAPEPASGWYTTYLGIAFSATDVSGVSSVHWSSDGAFTSNGDAYDDSWIGFDLTVDGVTEVWGWAYDAFGIRTDSIRRTVRIDTIAPSIAVSLPALPATGVLEVEQGAVVPLSFDCTDEHSGIASCLWQEELPALAAGATLPTGELGAQTVAAFLLVLGRLAPLFVPPGMPPLAVPAVVAAPDVPVPAMLLEPLVLVVPPEPPCPAAS